MEDLFKIKSNVINFGESIGEVCSIEIRPTDKLFSIYHNYEEELVERKQQYKSQKLYRQILNRIRDVIRNYSELDCDFPTDERSGFAWIYFDKKYEDRYMFLIKKSLEEMVYSWK